MQEPPKTITGPAPDLLLAASAAAPSANGVQTRKPRHRKQKPATEAIHWKNRLQEFRRTLDKQNDRLVDLTHQLERALHHQDEVQSVLDETRELLAANGLSEAGGAPYQQLVRRIHDTVRKCTPHGATVLIASKGDPDLLKLSGRIGWHFPQQADGTYAGFYPANSLAAIAQLEVLRSKGADYLVFPKSAFWWLDHYVELRQFIENRYVQLVRQDDTCIIYCLHKTTASADRTFCWQTLEQLFDECGIAAGEEPALLDWDTGLELAKACSSQRIVFSPPCPGGALPYFDGSIDIVAIASSDPDRMAEARRVARVAVVKFPGGQRTGERPSQVEIEYRTNKATAVLRPTSIVIPCHNALPFTQACLKSLFETLPQGFRGEIIVIDDASTDGTAAYLKALAHDEKRLKILHNRKNLGFLASCNRAARRATGEILLFLNNDTILLPGWLSPLLRVFEQYPEAGAVGGKLLFPDGRLQEAGGMVFCEGSADHFGREDYQVAAPAYSFLREVDYCSGALLATKRSLFLEVGCFDERFMPGYYEDTDYCFTVRSRGYPVYYQPESVIVHFEGATAGRDLSAGPKRYQVVNRSKFVEKWAADLERQPRPWNRHNPLGLLA